MPDRVPIVRSGVAERFSRAGEDALGRRQSIRLRSPGECRPYTSRPLPPTPHALLANRDRRHPRMPARQRWPRHRRATRGFATGIDDASNLGLPHGGGAILAEIVIAASLDSGHRGRDALTRDWRAAAANKESMISAVARSGGRDRPPSVDSKPPRSRRVNGGTAPHNLTRAEVSLFRPRRHTGIDPPLSAPEVSPPTPTSPSTTTRHEGDVSAVRPRHCVLMIAWRRSC